MCRALALAAAVVSARQDYACREDVCFYHIPKTGGDSFKYLLRDELKRQKRTFWSNEWCPTRSNGTKAMLFREPRAHVVSQYFECRDSEWALGNKAKWERHGTFPRNSSRRDPYAGFKQWIRHFANNGEGDFGCYDPRDMQARYVTCTCERTCAHHLTQPHPTPARAAAGLAALDVVGVMEHFDASACLVMDAAGIQLPDACFCDSSSSFTGARYHVAHGVAHHSPRDLDQETLAAIDALTALDRHLYNAARRIFARRVGEVEARLGRRILCDTTRRAAAGLATADPSLEAQYFADVRANAGADVLRGRLELYSPDAWRDAWQPRDVEFNSATVMLAYAKNEKSLKDKRRIEGTVAAARALKLHLRLKARGRFPFGVSFATGENLTWAASTKEERDRWLAAFQLSVDTRATRRAWDRASYKPLAPRGACPKVFVYDLPELWDYPTPLSAFHEERADAIFGQRCEESEYGTLQYHTALIILWRLLRDTRCATRTLDPRKADLFLAPTFPARRGLGAWKECDHVEDLDRHLLYLNERTAHRHLFILNKGHTADKCRWWLQHNVRGDLLTRSMRFAYSPPYRVKEEELHQPHMAGVAQGSSHGPTPFDDDALAEQLRVDPADAWDPTVGYPHTVSIPYTSDIHAYRGTRPWAVTTAKRERLAMYVGQQHGKYGLATRDKVYAECRDAANATCQVYDPRDMDHKCGFAAIHREAIFCFEPGGDSPYRKGFYDAMSAGCIPVIFSLQNELVAPWFVPKGVAVRLSERKYGNGTFKALDVLRRIPSEEIRRRQSIIRKHGHRLQYAVDDLGEEPDAVETLFVGALGLAHDLAALYQV